MNYDNTQYTTITMKRQYIITINNDYKEQWQYTIKWKTMNNVQCAQWRMHYNNYAQCIQ